MLFSSDEYLMQTVKEAKLCIINTIETVKAESYTKSKERPHNQQPLPYS